MKYLDTRELEERRQELQDLKDELDEAREALKEAGLTDEEIDKAEEVKERLTDAESEFGEAEAKELEELTELLEQCYGETLIPCSEFTEYAQELAEETGAVSDYSAWPANCIDWEEAAEQLAMDYSTVTYQGTDYYVRS